MMTRKLGALMGMATLVVSVPASAWSIRGTVGDDNWILGTNASTGELVICDRNANAFIPWPGSGIGAVPSSPLTEHGSIDMRGGDDVFEVAINGGNYGCGWMEYVDYDIYHLTIKGGLGNDILIGGSGVDNIFGDDTSDPDACEEDEDGGDDQLFPRGDADYVYGCGGNDAIHNDLLPEAGSVFYGGQGADCIEAVPSITLYCTGAWSTTDGDPDTYGAGLGGLTVYCDTAEDNPSTALSC